MESRGSCRRAFGVVLLAGAVVATGVACTEPAAAPAPARRSFIVGLRADASPDVVADENARRGRPVSWRLRSAMRGFVASLTDDDARDLATDGRVMFVEPDFEVTTQAQITPSGVGRIGAPANSALRINTAQDGDVNAAVAVVDSGVDVNSPDLNLAPGVTCIGGSCRSGGMDDNGHGTHVAGTIGAKDDGNGVVGVAPGARIVPVKVLSSRGTGPMSQIIAGLDWVAGQSSRIDVVNMSLGGVGTSQALNAAIANLINRGVVVVVASGNSRRNAALISPANIPDVITVSAVADYNGQPGGGSGAPSGCRSQGTDDNSASFSNYGNVVDIAAPGVCITSLRRGGGLQTSSGTSMASPHVAGAAALLASRSKPRDRAGVLALSQTLIRAGSTDWRDTSPDGIREPLLNVSNASVFNASMVGGTGQQEEPPPPTNPPTTNPPTTAAPTLSVQGTSTLGWRRANLTWRNLPGAQATIYRNGVPVMVTTNSGSYSDLAGFLSRSATYRVCSTGTTTCTPDAAVTF